MNKMLQCPQHDSRLTNIPLWFIISNSFMCPEHTHTKNNSVRMIEYLETGRESDYVIPDCLSTKDGLLRVLHDEKLWNFRFAFCLF